MPQQDTTATESNEEQVDSGVETEHSEDENEDTEDEEQEGTETANENEDDDSSEDDDDSNDDDSETEDEDKPAFKKRFTQFKGDSLEEYVPNLEEAHAKSITEAQRLAKENKDLKKDSDAYNKMLDFLNANPKIKKAVEEAGQTVGQAKVDPALEYAREQMNKQLQSEYDKFAESHPDILTDEEVRDAVLDELEAIDQVFAAKGRKLTMTEGLQKAWNNLYGDSKDKVMDKAKNEASKPNAQKTPTKKADKVEFTEEQLKIAKKMGVTPEQLAAANKK